MKKYFIVFAFLYAFGFMTEAGAAESPDISINTLPSRYSFVEGDTEKFRAHHWMKDRYAGGIHEFELKGDPLKGLSVTASGRALIDENDFEGAFSVKKEGVGFLNFDYQEFRKYYDGTGGVYRRFTTLRVNGTDKELALDIGHLRVEAGLTPEELPDITFIYEHEFKNGSKSRLTWTAVRDGFARNIGPSWQDIDETVDSFEIQIDHELAGFALKGNQRWEFVRSDMTREEKNLSTTTTASDKKIRVQDQRPETDVMTTTVGAERWFYEDKAFASTGYHFVHLHNEEIEDIFEMNENRVIQNFTNPKQIRNAEAENDFDSHTWVANFMALPWQGLNVATKLRSEIFQRQGNSTYPSDSTPVAAGGASPNGIINTTELSSNDSNAVRWGEGVSLRFNKIPRTALYSELEFEQIKNRLAEDRTSRPGESGGNVNEIFSRETMTYSYRNTWTLGGHMAPVPKVNITGHIRQRSNKNDYEDERETQPGAATARSAFMDELNIDTVELMSRIAWKPFRWFQPAFRYQLRRDDFFARVEDQTEVETDMNSHTFTSDLVLQPIADLLATVSYSRQNAKTWTPASSASTANTPAFRANGDTWLFNVEYILSENLMLLGALQYSRAHNFNDFTDAGLPLGTDHDRIDFTCGLDWALTKNISLRPHYGFYHFNGNEDVEFGDYDAHVISISASIGWA